MTLFGPTNALVELAVKTYFRATCIVTLYCEPICYSCVKSRVMRKRLLVACTSSLQVPAIKGSVGGGVDQNTTQMTGCLRLPDGHEWECAPLSLRFSNHLYSSGAVAQLNSVQGPSRSKP